MDGNMWTAQDYLAAVGQLAPLVILIVQIGRAHV